MGDGAEGRSRHHTRSAAGRARSAGDELTPGAREQLRRCLYGDLTVVRQLDIAWTVFGHCLDTVRTWRVRVMRVRDADGRVKLRTTP